MAATASTSKGTTAVEAVDLESRIIQLCQQNPKGITNSALLNAIPNVTTQQSAVAINRLLSQGQLDLLKQGNEIVYRVKDPEAASKVKGADTEEKIVYQIIEKAGNKGIWIRDIRVKSNLLMTQVNKILKSLESKKFIKAVKSVNASKKKVYMFFNLEPDRSLTGGTWYSDQDFESEFVDVLYQQCLSYLMKKAASSKSHAEASASTEDVWKFVNDLGISKVDLSVDDIQSILNILHYDGKVATWLCVQGSKNVTTYMAVKPIAAPPGILRVPCGFCPMLQECEKDAVISPDGCHYLKDWLGEGVSET